MMIEVVLIKDVVEMVWVVYHRMTVGENGEPPAELEFYLYGILQALQNYRITHGGKAYISKVELVELLRRCKPAEQSSPWTKCNIFFAVVLDGLGVDEYEG